VAKTVRISDVDKAMKKMLENADEKIMRAANTAVKKTAIKAWGDIIKMTPVDTGRARNNWFIGTTVGNETAGAGNKDASYVAQNLPKQVIGTTLYFYNNLPYINKLEFGGYPKNVKKGTRLKGGGHEVKTAGGYSKQAPKGMVRASLSRWGANLSRIFKEEMEK
jgi:hypothetical protein